MFTLSPQAIRINPLSQECPTWLGHIDTLPEALSSLGKYSVVVSGLSDDNYFSEVLDEFDTFTEALEFYLAGAFDASDHDLLSLRVTIKGPNLRDHAKGSYFHACNGPLIFALLFDGTLHTYRQHGCLTIAA